MFAHNMGDLIVFVDCFGTEFGDSEMIAQYVRDSYDLTPKGIIDRLHLLDIDYNKISSCGHFRKRDLSWKM